MRKHIIGAIGMVLGGALLAALTESAIPDAGTVAAKWSTRTQAAQQDYVSGVQNTDKDPTALAIAQGQRYIQRTQEAFNSGKWANGLRRAGKAGWQAATIAKASSFASGVAASEQKVQTAFAPLLAYETSLQSRVQSMPNVTLQDRIARATAWITGMHDYTPPA